MVAKVCYLCHQEYSIPEAVSMVSSRGVAHKSCYYKRVAALATVSSLQKAASFTAGEHGFSEQPNIAEKIALCHSELSEALEEYRDDKLSSGVYYNPESSKPLGFGIELADAVIRIMHLAELAGVNHGHHLP